MLELLASEFRLIAQDVIAFALIACAFVLGGGPERAAALTWLVVFEISGHVYKSWFGSALQLDSVDTFLAASDLVAGVCWITIALYANRNYTLWIAGIQVVAMFSHVARGLVEAVSPVAYLTMVVAPGWFQLLFLSIGLTRHIRRKKRFGEYRDWRISNGNPWSFMSHGLLSSKKASGN